MMGDSGLMEPCRFLGVGSGKATRTEADVGACRDRLDTRDMPKISPQMAGILASGSVVPVARWQPITRDTVSPLFVSRLLELRVKT